MTTERAITITVETTRGTKTLTVEKTTKVGEVIAKVVALCGFNPGDRFAARFARDVHEYAGRRQEDAEPDHQS